MRIYKRTRRDDGQVKQARRWHVEWFDQRNQLKRRTPGYTDKSATEELGRKLERLSAIAAQQDEPDGDLRRWIETLPAKMMQTLVGYGLIDQRRAAASKTLAEHVEDYHQRQLSAGVTKKTADHSRMRVLAICSAAKAKYWSDLTASKVQNAIAGIRTHGKPLKIGNRNAYLTSMKAFVNWMIEDRRASRSPLGPKGDDSALFRRSAVQSVLASSAPSGPIISSFDFFETACRLNSINPLSNGVGQSVTKDGQDTGVLT